MITVLTILFGLGCLAALICAGIVVVAVLEEVCAAIVWIAGHVHRHPVDPRPGYITDPPGWRRP